MPYVKLQERLQPEDKPRPHRRIWRPTEKHVVMWVYSFAVFYIGLHVAAWVFGWAWWPPAGW